MNGVLFNISSNELMASTSAISSQVFQDFSPLLWILAGFLLIGGVLWLIVSLVEEISFRRRLAKYQKEIEEIYSKIPEKYR